MGVVYDIKVKAEAKFLGKLVQGLDLVKKFNIKTLYQYPLLDNHENLKHDKNYTMRREAYEKMDNQYYYGVNNRDCNR